MITKEMVKKGISKGIIKFIVNPNEEYGTVCSIGDNWFYFGGLTAEEENPEEFLNNSDMNEVIQSVFDTLEEFRKCDYDNGDEYLYYYTILSEGLCDNGCRVDLDTCAAIIGVFEKFLEIRGIDIPNDEREDDDNPAIIYGSDYFELEDEIKKILETM